MDNIRVSILIICFGIVYKHLSLNIQFFCVVSYWTFCMLTYFSGNYRRTWSETEKNVDIKVGIYVRRILFLVYYGMTYPSPVIICIVCPLVYWNEVMTTFGFTIHECERLLNLSLSSDWTIFWIVFLIILPTYIYFWLCCILRSSGILTTAILLIVYANHLMKKIWWVNTININKLSKKK